MTEGEILEALFVAKAEALEHFTKMIEGDGFYYGGDVKLCLFQAAQVYREHANNATD